MFDLARWCNGFPLANVPEDERSGQTICSPRTLACVEQFRRKARPEALGPSVPVDVFVFAFGEPQDRGATKVGGLPYLRAGDKWPVDDGGVPLTFVAQFNFTESIDIVPPLPGDLLLVFARNEGGGPGTEIYTGDPPFFHFEWRNTEECELIGPDTVPTPAQNFLTGWGVRHRTVDYLDERLASNRLRPLIPDAARTGLPEEWEVRSACRFDAMKIGGLPMWFFPDDPDIDHIPGEFVCALPSLCPLVDQRFPWINQDAAISSSTYFNRPELKLLWRDGGTVYYFINRDGTVDWHVQFY